jgi:hypothetical protein
MSISEPRQGRRRLELASHRSWQWTVVALGVCVAGACHHDASFDAPARTTLGPAAGGSPTRLTLNVDQDMWPVWTQDGSGILYSYVDLADRSHRCLGLLPAGGGTRTWEVCDSRFTQHDTVSSFTAYALSTDGRLLYAVSSSGIAGGVTFPPRTTLWLADTAKPFVRTALLTLPLTVSSKVVNWLADLMWTGPNTFLALGQQLGGVAGDSIFADGGIVLAGTITGAHANVVGIAGTDSATSYSLTQRGATVVFTLHHDLRLFSVPVTGGAPEPAPVHRDVPDTAATLLGELAGVSCNATACVVARDAIFLAGGYLGFCGSPPHFQECQFPARLLVGPMELLQVDPATGSSQVLVSSGGNMTFATPQVSPVSGDVVVQIGGGWGHLQTFAGAKGDLFVYRGLLP